MNLIDEKLNIPSTEAILQELKLQYDGQYEAANPDATFSFSVPVITDECPGNLRYFPLSKISHYALNEDFNKQDFWDTMKGNRYGVIICNSFDKTDGNSGSRFTLRPYQNTFSYIAAFWDAAEDPLMATTLYSCMFITQAAPPDSPAIFERVPVFLKPEQINLWLSPELSFEEREKMLFNL